MSTERNQLIQNALKTNKTFQIQLIGNNGSVFTDALPLIICSPMLRDCLCDLEDKPYPVAITVPDVDVICFKVLIKFMKEGFVHATESVLHDLSHLIDLLAFKIYCGKYEILGPDRNNKEKTTSTLESDHNAPSPRQVEAPRRNRGIIKDNTEWEYGSLSEESEMEEEEEVIQQTFICDICNISFGNEDTLKLHQETRCFKYLECKVCGFKSSNLVEKLDHACTIHEGIELYRCNICKKSYAEQHIMLVHKQMHVTTKHNCPVCKITLPSLFLLVKHVENHTNEEITKGKKEVQQMRKTMKYPKENLVCSICNIHCGSGIDKVTHSCKVPAGHKKFTCEICNLSYGEESIFLIHKSQHLKMPQLKVKCPLCPKVIPPILHLVTHVRTHLKEFGNTGSGSKVLKCPKCSQTFFTHVRLALHRYTHVGKSELNCPYCEKHFKHEDDTVRHMISKHNRMASADKKGKTLLPCENCEKSFPSEIALQLHQQIHKGKSELECPYCESEFTNHLEVVLHMRKHVGIMCRTCNKSFKNIWELRQHKKICVEGDKINGTENTGEKHVSSETTNENNETINNENNEVSNESDPEPQKIVNGKNKTSETEQNDFEYATSINPCSVCPRKFRLKARLLQHEQSHKDKSFLECPLCNKVCQTRQGTVTHIDSHFGYTCSVCLRIGFWSYPDLIAHRKEHKKE